jgi:hypothetical protein
MRICGELILVTAVGVMTGCNTPKPALPKPEPPAAPRSQNPSPMVESVRKHERISSIQPAGLTFRIDSVLPRSVDVFIPALPAPHEATSDERTLLVHLFSAPYVPMHAVALAQSRYVLAVVNLGSGSSSYERPLSDTVVWNRLIRKVQEETGARTNGRVRIGRIVVSAFSAGYGGVRALLGDDHIASEIDAVILLDGLHVSYVPERTVISEGGVLDTTRLAPFARYARKAVGGEVRMLITHSEIYPGTFASTTETTDWLIKTLGLVRTPVLAWGPGGMQQLSESRSGGLLILGFAGNTGPDHIDHLHGLPEFLNRLDAIPVRR